MNAAAFVAGRRLTRGRRVRRGTGLTGVEGAQQQAALAVRRVLDGGTLGAALAAAAVGEDAAGGRRHALVQELAYGTLRHWGTLDALTRRVATKPLTDPLLACLVAVALYQLDHTRAPPFAVVNHAVDNAATMVRPAAKALVNALLRRYLREREALLNAAVRADPVARWSYPRWWIDRAERRLSRRLAGDSRSGQRTPAAYAAGQCTRGHRVTHSSRASREAGVDCDRGRRRRNRRRCRRAR